MKSGTSGHLFPISTDVRDFLYRDVYPVTERRIIRLFRTRFTNEQEYDDAHDDIYDYLMQHIVQTEQRTIIEDTEEGKQLKMKRLVSKMSKLRCILFEEKEEGDKDTHVHDEMIPLMEHLEMKEKLENLLLEARDEIVELNRIMIQRCSPAVSRSSSLHNSPSPNEEKKEKKENEEEEFDADYVGINTMLNELAAMREIRRRHGAFNMDNENETEELKEITSHVGPEESLDEDEEKEKDEEKEEDKEEQTQDIEEITELTAKLHMDTKEEEHLECPICYSVLNTDTDSPDYTGCCIGQFCGHALCETCWKDYRRRRNKICPVCKQLLFIGRGRPPKASVW